VAGTVAVPPSKSVTQRALVAAAIASGRSSLRGPLLADDNRRLIEALGHLGIGIRVLGPGEPPAVPEGASAVEVEGCGGRITADRASLQVGNAGTAMRFLTALCAFGSGEYIIDGDARMRQRPIDELLEALRALGARAESLHGNGCPPVRVGGGAGGPGRRDGAGGATVRLHGERSSQFLSALLLAAPELPSGIDITLDGVLVSRPYVDLTTAVMARFGVEVGRQPPGPGVRRFTVAPGSAYRGTDYTIEGDWSSASYFFAAAAVTGGRVTVTGLERDSAQGDARFLALLERMGCRVAWRGAEVEVEGGAPGTGGAEGGMLRGIEADCRDMPDIVPTLAVVALFASGPTRITGVPHLRLKETDRIAALVSEINRLGARATAAPDGLKIEPCALRGATVETYDDHRMAMAFAVAGLRVPGLAVVNPGCVTKSFPDFWERLDRILA
jgi:3-phosphoshikimate 1-carboxyvinyltransferase